MDFFIFNGYICTFSLGTLKYLSEVWRTAFCHAAIAAVVQHTPFVMPVCADYVRRATNGVLPYRDVAMLRTWRVCALNSITSNRSYTSFAKIDFSQGGLMAMAWLFRSGVVGSMPDRDKIFFFVVFKCGSNIFVLFFIKAK